MFFLRFVATALLVGQSWPVYGEILVRLDDRRIRSAGIETTAVDSESGVAELTLPGVVAVPPQQLRVVAAPAAGLVEAMLVGPDETVSAGQPIARLRSTDLIDGQRSFLTSIADEALLREKLTRDETLFAERIIAERRLLVARADHARARFAVDERQQYLALLGMSDSEIGALRARRQISSVLTITAPVAGYVLQRQSNSGERVAASSPLVTIAVLRPLWVNVQVPVSRVTAVAAAAGVVIPAHGASGAILRVGRSADPVTQSVTAIAEIGPGAENLRPGQAVSVTVALPANGKAQWRVPASAVVRHRDRSWVLAKVPEGFDARPVTILAETPQFVSLRADLAPGDRVASQGLLALLAELAEADKY